MIVVFSCNEFFNLYNGQRVIISYQADSLPQDDHSGKNAFTYSDDTVTEPCFVKVAQRN